MSQSSPPSPPIRPAKARLRARRLAGLDARLPRRRREIRAFKNPFLARAGGQTVGGPLPGARLTRGIAPLVFLGLAFLGVRFFAGQGLSVSGQIERAARREFIPQLEAQLGEKIEVGRFSTDWLGRIQIENIVVGRNPNLATGALLRAKSATISADLIGVALRRKTALDAISRISLEAPEMTLLRAANGQFNLQKLFKSDGPAREINLDATLDFSQGRVFYRDLALRGADGAPLQLDARGVSGSVVARPGAPFRFRGDAPQIALGNGGQSARNLTFSGLVEPKKPTAILRVGAPSLSAPFAANYLFRRGDLRALRGEVGGQIVLSLSGKTLLPSGEIEVRGVDFETPKLRAPRGGKPGAGEIWRGENLRGALRFAGTHLETGGLQTRALGADWTASGALSIAERTAFDVRLQSANAPVSRLLSFVDARAIPAQISVNRAALDTQISGDLQNLNIAGTLSGSGLRARGNGGELRGFAGNAPAFRALFAAQTAPKSPVKFAARAAFDAVRANGAIPRNVARLGGSNADFAARNVVLSARGVASARAALEIGVQSGAWQLGGAQLGRSRGARAQILASNVAPGRGVSDWRGDLEVRGADLNGLRLAAISGEAARSVQSIGNADLRAQFGGVGGANPFFEADFAATNLRLRENAIPDALRRQISPQLAREIGDLRALRGQISLRDGRFALRDARAQTALGRVGGAFVGGRVALDLPLEASAARQINALFASRGVALDADWRGRVSVVSLAAPGAYRALVSAAAPQLAVRSGGANRLRLRAPLLRGVVQFGAGGWNASATVNAREIAVFGGRIGATQIVIPAPLSGARVAQGKLILSASSAQNLRWNARFEAARLAVPSPLRGDEAPRTLTFGNPSAVLGSVAGGVEISRASANWGELGRLSATGTVRGGAVWARILARDVEANALQRFVAVSSQREAVVSGKINALATLEPRRNPILRFQMPTGRVRVVAQSLDLPINALRGEVEVAPTRVLVREARLWSAGALLQLDGDFALRNVANAAPNRESSARVRVAGLRLNRVPLGENLRDGARVDGLLSGDFNVKLGASPTIEGRTTLKGATLAGADIAFAQGNLEATRDPEGWRFALRRLSGQIEDAPFTADLETDIAQNYWRLTLETPDLQARRVALLTQRATGRERNLPIRGQFFADIDINGEFRPREGETNRPFWIPRAGYAKLQSNDIRWRGRAAGALLADFAFLGDVARINKLELNPPPETILTGDGAANEISATETVATETAATDETPRISVEGVLPLLPDLERLDAKVDIGEAPLEFFRKVLREAEISLGQIDVEIPALSRTISYVNALPEGTRGRVALEASLRGSWQKPQIRVDELTLRGGRAPLPTGGLSAPARLDAAFSYANGVLQIENSAFQIEKTPEERGEGDVDNTILRVARGGIDEAGNINITADIFNANLSQLASWVPALRDASGAPIVRGTVTDFSVSLGGTTQNPQITASFGAENLAGAGYSLDRVLISRLEVRDGYATIEPGNLTIAKGRFASRTAFARVPFDLRAGGLQRDKPFSAGLDLQTRDFLALAGVFVPALRDVSAGEISGNLGVGGTLNEPRFSGELAMRDVAFRVESGAAPFPVALRDLNGTVRILDGNRLVFDPQNPLRARLADARPAPATPPEGEVRNVASTAQTPRAATQAISASGTLSLGGQITFDLSSETLALGARGLGRHFYDLQLSLEGASVSTPLLSGLRDADAAVLLRSDENRQLGLRWMLAARGAKTNTQRRGGGDLVSVGALNLRRDFASGTNSILRSQAQDFESAQGFENFAVAKRVNLQTLSDRRPQFVFDNWQWGYTGVGNGEVAGRLVLDNREAIRSAPVEARQLLNSQIRPPRGEQNDSPSAPPAPSESDLAARLEAQRASSPSPWLRFDVGGERRLPYRSTARIAADLFGVPFESAGGDGLGGEALRLGGDLELKNADIFGAPAGEGGTFTRLSNLPEAPRFDIGLQLGQRVNFVNSVFRTRLGGELVASGTPRDPQILGTVSLSEGVVRFPNARARIEEGTLRVAITRDAETDLLRSSVDIDAEARGTSGIYQVTLKLQGPLELSGGDSQANRLQVDVTSNPPLSQSEAFAQLLGLSPSDLSRQNDDGDFDFDSGRANQAYAQAVLQFVAAPFFDGFERSVARALGLDSVGFEYRFNEPLSIQLSKSLGDRVFVSYRRSLGNVNGSRNAPEELRVDYRVRGDYLLGFKIDEQNVYGITLQRTWRF